MLKMACEESWDLESWRGLFVWVYCGSLWGFYLAWLYFSLLLQHGSISLEMDPFSEKPALVPISPSMEIPLKDLGVRVSGGTPSPGGMPVITLTLRWEVRLSWVVTIMGSMNLSPHSSCTPTWPAGGSSTGWWSCQWPRSTTLCWAKAFYSCNQ